MPAAAQVRLPSLGEAASQDLTVGAERRIGDEIMREARRDPEYLDDPVLLDYLQSIWQPLLAAARHLGNIDADTDQAFAWEPFLVNDRSVNAFALPGGYVGAHLGLIAITSTRDQLASVMAHELTHVTQRHIARSIAPQQQASIMSLAAILLGVLAASRTGNSDIANAAIMGGQGAAIQGQLNFSRDMEREADRVGFGLLADGGFAPSGMAQMFEKMDLATRLSDNSSYPYLRSHPLTVDRISESRNRTLLSRSPPSAPTLQHAMMQMRARVLMDTSTQNLQRLSNGSSASTQRSDRIGALYGGALASSLLKEHARAETLITQALQLATSASPREPQAERALRLLQAQVLITKGDPAAALRVLDDLPGGPAPEQSSAAEMAADAAAASAGNGQAARFHLRPPLLLRAQAALDLRQQDAAAAPLVLRSSTEALQTWLVDQPADPLAWELLARTTDALGLRLRSLRAGAEARAAVGDINGAIDRLRAAQQGTRTAGGQDFIEASVIDARMRQLTAQRRALVLEARGENPTSTKPPDDPTPAPVPAPVPPPVPAPRPAPAPSASAPQ